MIKIEGMPHKDLMLKAENLGKQMAIGVFNGADYNRQMRLNNIIEIMDDDVKVGEGIPIIKAYDQAYGDTINKLYFPDLFGEL